MKSARHEILNPVGEKAAGDAAGAAVRRTRGGKPVVGLLNNSKPNVSYFLETIEKDIRAQGYRTVNVTKPRSAGPCVDVESLAERCDYVINAVAD
jgi:hypothetical protein